MDVIYISDDDDDVERIAPKLEDTAIEMDMTNMSDDDDDKDNEDGEDDDNVEIFPILEETATEMDMTNISEVHPISEDVLYITEDEDGHLENWNMGNILNDIEDCVNNKNVDIVDGVREVASFTDVASLAEETEGSEEEQDVNEELDSEMSDKEIHTFCKDASKAFFDEWGLISHQLNSFNDFMSNGLQEVFDDFGDYDVEPDYNPQRRRSDGLCYRTSISFGKVTVENPSYCSKEGKNLPLKPSEARLRNMTYSSPVYVEMTTKVYIQEGIKTDIKSKSSSCLLMKDARHATLLSEDRKRVLVGKIPVMVKSHLCYLSRLTRKELLKEGDCLFDAGGYFIIKGHEKVFVAQEERCTNRIWVASTPKWMATYTPYRRGFTSYRNTVFVKIIKTSKDDKYCAGREVLTVNFLSITVPLVLMFYALGVESDSDGNDR